MLAKKVGAAEFKAKCLALIEEMNHSKVPIIVTNRGKPVAEMFPARAADVAPQSLLGAMKSTVYSYNDPFGAAIDPNEWEANR